MLLSAAAAAAAAVAAVVGTARLYILSYTQVENKGSTVTTTGRMQAPGSAFARPVGFKAEYFDPVAGLLKTFLLTYFPNGKLQMVSD